MTYRRQSIILLSVLVASSASGVHAQLTFPTPLLTGTENTTRPLSAAQAAYYVKVQGGRLDASISYRNAHYPIDSINAVMIGTSTQLLTRVIGHPIQGIQHDPASMVGATARDTAFAKAQIAARLATPGLSFGDKAFTYVTAVQAFANRYRPEQLPTAEAYLAQLDAMGDSAAYWRFQARRVLVDVYYELGRGNDVIIQGTRAIHLLPVMSFYDVGLMFRYTGGDGKLYAATAAALSGQPDGLARLSELNAIVKRAIVPSAATIALDSGFMQRASVYQHEANALMTVHSMLGKASVPIIANYWLNRPSHDSASISLNDGKIHVLEVGSYTCGICLIALQGMQRIQNRFPDVNVMMATWTLGFWGNRVIDPDETAQLEHYYSDDAKVTIPIGIWRGKKQLMEDGGSRSEDAGPNLQHYPMVEKPTIWVFDGHGIVRRVIVGYSREYENDIIQLIEYLHHEAAAPGPLSGVHS